MAAAVTRENGVPKLTYGERTRRARERWREAARAGTDGSVDAASIPDPLLRDPASRRAATIAIAIAGSFAVHVGVTLLASLAKGDAAPRIKPYEQAVQVQIVEPPKPPAAPPPLETPTPPPPPPPVAVKPVKVQKAEVPPPDPVDTQTPPPPEPPKEPPRRIVGISMESSTVGAGPAFAVGNTRMGQTAQVAEDPSHVEHLTAETTPPRRISAPIPDYPKTLHGIEGEVTLELEIDPSGHVAKVTIVVPSEHEEFNRLAKEAAERSTYEPAKRNGVAVAATIPSTVRFRPRE